MSQFKIWIDATRPKTLTAGLSPVLMGTVLAAADGHINILLTTCCLFAALSVQIGTNLANDYFDNKKGADTKERLGPTRATATGLISESTMKNAFIFAFALALIFALYPIYMGGVPILIIAVLSLIFGILYTATPYALAYTGMADIIAFLFFGPIAVTGTYYLLTSNFSWPVFIYGCGLGFFSAALLSVNNIRDRAEDTKSNKKTLVVRFGYTFGRLEYTLSIIIAALIPVCMYISNSIFIWSSLTILIIPMMLPIIKHVWEFNDVSLNLILQKTGQFLLIYTLIFCVGVLASL